MAPNPYPGPSGGLRVLLVGGGEACAEVRAALEQLDDLRLEIYTQEPADAGLTPDEPAADVIMVLFAAGSEERALDYLERQASAAAPPALFALLGERALALMRRILRAGADEILFAPLEAGDVTRALLKVSERRRRSQRDRGGIVVSLASLTGGVGVSSLAANLALALRRRNQRVALVDLDLQSGALASLLNLEPEGGIVRLCERERELDSMLLEAALSKHPSGLYLLAAPARIEDGELVSDQVIGAALDLMRQLFDCVIVDCGGRIDENAVAAWERSAHLFYLIDQTIAAVRGAWRFLELFGHLGVAGLEPAFILSRYQARHPLSAGRIESTLGRPLFARIPRDEATLERAQLSGRDLWETSARAPLTSAIESLSLRLSAGDGAAPEERGIVARLFSAVGAAR